MSRRRRDHRSDEQRERGMGSAVIEVLCTGRGTHSRELFARYDVLLAQFEELDDSAAIEALRSQPWLTAAVPQGAPELYLASDTLEDTHFTRTFRCRKCSRNLPMRENVFDERLLILARHGVRTVDLSRLDRVRLS